MEQNSTTTEAAPLFAGEAWFDPIEAEVRERVRQFLESMIDEEATAALGRGRYERGAAAGYRNGTRKRRLLGSFGPVEIAVTRARLTTADGATREWRSAVLPRYARMTRHVEALIASAYLSGTNTRRVKQRSGRCSKAPSARTSSVGCGASSRLAVSRKSTVSPALSTALYKYFHLPLIRTYVSSSGQLTRTERLSKISVK